MQTLLNLASLPRHNFVANNYYTFEDLSRSEWLKKNLERYQNFRCLTNSIPFLAEPLFWLFFLVIKHFSMEFHLKKLENSNDPDTPHLEHVYIVSIL